MQSAHVSPYRLRSHREHPEEPARAQGTSPAQPNVGQDPPGNLQSPAANDQARATKLGCSRCRRSSNGCSRCRQVRGHACKIGLDLCGAMLLAFSHAVLPFNLAETQSQRLMLCPGTKYTGWLSASNEQCFEHVAFICLYSRPVYLRPDVGHMMRRGSR